MKYDSIIKQFSECLKGILKGYFPKKEKKMRSKFSFQQDCQKYQWLVKDNDLIDYDEKVQF